MIEGKEDGFARKRKARDKANMRLVKNQHWIVPSLIGLFFLGCLVGGTIVINHASPIHTALIAFVCGVIAMLAFGDRVIHELTK